MSWSFEENVKSVLFPRGEERSCRVGLIRYFLVLCLCCILQLSECVLRLPEFPEPIKNVTLQVGSDVEFSCDVRHLGAYRVAWSWKKGDEQKFLGIGIVKIISDPRVHISRIQKSDDVTQFNLYIYNIKKDDSGTYSCSVNSNPMIEQVGTLDVTGDEYANGNNGKIVNGKSVALPPKPVRKGVDSSHRPYETDDSTSQANSNSTSSLRATALNNTNNSTLKIFDDSTLLCIDLSEIWDNAREKIETFLSTFMRLTYSYLFS